MKRLLQVCFFIVIVNISHIAYCQKLIAHYPFDNSTSDISGNKNDGKIFGGVTANVDRFGNPCGSLNFNGTDGYIEVPNSISLQSPVLSFSATCWFKIENLPLLNGIRWLTLICKGNQTLESISNPQYRVQTFQSAFQSTISINTDFTEYDNNFSKHLLTFDKWNFYALIYDGKFVKCYLNNIKIWEYAYNEALTPNTESLHIGKDAPGSLEFFCGSLDDLRIYNAPLNENELTQLYMDISSTSFDDEFTLTCPNNIIAYTEKDKCSAIVNYSKPELNINCGSASLTQIAGLPSGTQFPVGISMLSFEVKSNSGFKKTCIVKVTVLDAEAPLINCKSDTTIFTSDLNKNSVKFHYEMPTATDKCSSVNIKLVEGLLTDSEFPIGTSLLKFRATDKSGNSVECSFIVTVKKNITIQQKQVAIKIISDTLMCPSDIKKFNDSHKCGAIVNYSLNKEGREIKLVDGQASGTFFPVGTTSNKFVIGSTQKECSFEVVVIDNEKPQLTCPNDIVIYTTLGKNLSKVSYSLPLANDNCGIDSLIQISGKKSNDPFPIGTTQNIFKVIDNFGNFTTCSFNITVIDTSLTKPKDFLQDFEFKLDVIPDSIRYIKQAMEFNSCIVTVSMYDDSQQDYDTISVFFNKKEIVSKRLIKLKKNGTINCALMLNAGEKNDFIVKAWSNGKISPNTLKVDFYEGYYLDRMKKIKNKKPDSEKTFHSKPGFAAAIYLNCKN